MAVEFKQAIRNVSNERLIVTAEKDNGASILYQPDSSTPKQHILAIDTEDLARLCSDFLHWWKGMIID